MARNPLKLPILAGILYSGGRCRGAQVVAPVQPLGPQVKENLPVTWRSLDCLHMFQEPSPGDGGGGRV